MILVVDFETKKIIFISAKCLDFCSKTKRNIDFSLKY